MSVLKDKQSNTWYVQVRINDPTTNETIHHKKRGFKLKREALKYEQDILYEEHGVSISKSVTFRDMSEEWFNFANASAGTRKIKRQHFRKRCTMFYDMPFDHITRKLLAKWKIELMKTDFAPKTKNMTISYVKGVFAYASKVYGVDNPSVLLDPVKMPIKTEHHTVWTPDQFERFASCVEIPLYRLFFELLFYTGMRRGEALALSTRDITKDGYVHINKTIRLPNDGVKAPKTSGSVRKIKLDQKTFEDLQPLLARGDHDFLFGETRPLPLTTMQRQFKNAIKASGVPDIRVHDLRHSHATFLINNEVNIVAVSRRLGHSTVNETLKTYTHLLQKTSDELINKLNEIHV